MPLIFDDFRNEKVKYNQTKKLSEFSQIFPQKHDIGAIHSFTPNEGWEYGFEMPYNAANWVVGGWVTILG